MVWVMALRSFPGAVAYSGNTQPAVVIVFLKNSDRGSC